MPHVVFISDTHTLLDRMQIPPGDVLVHSGDACLHGSMAEFAAFAKTFRALPHPHKIYVPGNHDWVPHGNLNLAKDILRGVSVLVDERVDKAGLRFYGSPWQPEFRQMAYNLPRRGERLRQRWDAIPGGLDVLVTHGPPMGYLDVVEENIPGWGRNNRHVGCELLAEALRHARPRYHAFGHIHDQHGVAFGAGDHKGITFINAVSYVHIDRPTNPPILVDIKPVDKSFSGQVSQA